MRLNGTVFSETLEMDTGISIVTPNRLREDAPYRVVYLLHGLCGSSSSWLDYSLLPLYAMGGNTIYIMPDAARSFYTDMKYGFRYFTYITEELPHICRNIFHISADRENTAVMGCSMGGYGALKCALTHPEQYGMCGAFSSGCLFIRDNMTLLKEQGFEAAVQLFGRQLANDLVSVFGEDLEWKPEYEISALAAQAKAVGVLPKLYLTCGTEDHFYDDHRRFREVLDGMAIPYTYEEWQERHDLAYFNDALKKAIHYFAL